MATVDIVFREPDGKLIPLVLDAAVEEGHRANAMVTQHEVEQGVDLADHYRPERRQLTLDVRISDTPVEPNFAVRMGLTTVSLEMPPRQRPTTEPVFDGDKWIEPSIVTQGVPPIQAAVYQPVGDVTRIEDSWKVLMDARERSLLADITTKYDVYLDMALTQLSAPRSADDGTWMRAQLGFTEIRSVSTELVDDPVPARVRDRRQRDRGSQEGKPATDEEADTLGKFLPESESALSQGADAIGSFL